MYRVEEKCSVGSECQHLSMGEVKCKRHKILWRQIFMPDLNEAKGSAVEGIPRPRLTSVRCSPAERA